ncbi:hypothetical protein MtrunA17_Chr5g0433651 [Medicago truncatula]|uniref:Uncharacterized protein n=1 Tax=Medicago truncatula TaxID=3880 RepID=A0A396HZI5_MEDTR|nr:hypothetical protein MtrunA17_Chr5g0433651 [Medicago truncatula]
MLKMKEKERSWEHGREEEEGIKKMKKINRLDVGGSVLYTVDLQSNC